MKPIAFPLEQDMQGPGVADLHAALVLLEFTIAGAEKTAQRYGASTRQAVRKFQAQHQLPTTDGVDQATATAIDAALAGNGASAPTRGGDDLPPSDPPAEDQLFSVQGEVVRPDGTPLPNHLVRAYDRALCAWRQLGDEEAIVRTDDRGRYAITYYPALLTQWGKTRADLKVQVFDPATDDTTVLVESPLILRALPDETVNFAIGDELYRGPDEFTRLERALAPFLPSQYDLSCLLVADVLILAREAKQPSSNVAYYVKARRWSAELEAPAALFYGLMRRNQPTRLDALLARPLTRLWARLEEAKAQNIINLPLTAALRTRLADIQQAYLTQPGHPYMQLLSTTALSAAQQALFTQRLTAGDLTGDAFWESLESGDDFSTEQVIELKSAFELQDFADGNTSLTIHLRSAHNVRAPREVATFSVETWENMVLTGTTVEIPDEIGPGALEAERRTAYAQMLYRSAELRYPTPSAVHITSVALNVFMRYHPKLNGLSPYAVRTPQLSREQDLARAATALPEWETLFGSTDAYECSHCESTLSPAAYLVDMMAFLQRAVAVDDPEQNALDELLDRRRPDLGTLQLTCENTETELPHIDLQNQIMEAIVASPDHKTLFATAIGPTTWPSEHLDAQPEYLKPEAYEILREEAYPFDCLPFDLWLEEGRRYLKQMGIARDELMRVMPPRLDVGPLELATEALQIRMRATGMWRSIWRTSHCCTASPPSRRPWVSASPTICA